MPGKVAAIVLVSRRMNPLGDSAADHLSDNPFAREAPALVVTANPPEARRLPEGGLRRRAAHRRPNEVNRRRCRRPRHRRRSLRRTFIWTLGAAAIIAASAIGLTAKVATSFGALPAPVAAGPTSTLVQCTNGPLLQTLSPQPCVGASGNGVTVAIPGINGGVPTAYSNWVRGNANAQSSHWREGGFIAYRAMFGGLSTGVPHTLVFTYDTVASSGHAIDYLGSYDATETTSSTTSSSQGTIIHANNSNPCADLAAAGQFPWACTPSAPQGAGNFPPVTFTGPGGQTNCGGSPGTFTGTQIPGAMSLFGPPGSAIDSVSYQSENVVSGTGTCTTTVQVIFTVSQDISTSQSVVLAWGGHIASQDDWGLGNGAGSQTGSPFHTALISLDGASTGNQSVSMSASAIFFTPTVTTQVMVNGSP